jgi:outer membrane protein assembly factor BamE (lipoprotein component of BamABCDE complex)
MVKKGALLMVCLGAFLLAGCAETPYRESKIRYQHPKWDDATIRKVAKREVEPGMTADMVRAALGIPDAISRQGDEERWGYGVMVGNIQPQEELVFFVYLRYGVVTRTAGDKDRLRTVSWYK